jgi:glycosyltransferase involved in cell wall biosynthesis
MKVIVQIPCFDEEDTLAATIADVRRGLAGVAGETAIMVVDDGSRDRTAEIARELGVEHLIRHRRNRGLAATFRTGVDAALRLGADVIVNVDADNQYQADEIPKLIAPLLAGEADIVVGDRQTATLQHFSLTKRQLQRLGSFVVRLASGLEIPDAVSGFRAISREAALQMNIVSSFSYTIEMLVQADAKRMAVASVPVGVNPTARASRLYRNVPQFIERSVSTLLRTYAMYQPLKVFFALGLVLLMLGVTPVVRFLYFFVRGDGSGHVQSLVLGGALGLAGFVALMVGLLADLIAFNRRLLEMLLERARRWESADPAEEARWRSPPSAGLPAQAAVEEQERTDPRDAQQHDA